MGEVKQLRVYASLPALTVKICEAGPHLRMGEGEGPVKGEILYA